MNPKEEAEQIIREEINELYEECFLEETFPQHLIDINTARWSKKNGQTRYYQSSEKTHHNKLVLSDNGSDKHMLIVNRRMLEQDNEKEFRDTVRHELAHIISYEENGCQNAGHGKIWKRWAEIFGADPHSAHNKLEKDDYKYIVYCDNGDYEKKYWRKSKTIKNLWRYCCPKCGEDLNVMTREEYLGDYNNEEE